MSFSVLLASLTPTPGPSASPSPSSTGLSGLVSGSADRLGLNDSITCQRGDISVCGITWKLTGHENVGKVLQIILGTPLRLILIVLLGIAVRRILHKVIDELADKIATGRESASPALTGTAPPASASQHQSALLTTRREARARTLASVLRSVTTAVVWSIVTLMVLQELDFNVAPLLASAGVAGVALGFGSQSLVRDVISGMFMIVEDQYGVGDSVDLGEASGTVEAVGLRITRLRDVNGTVWYVRNGEVLRVGNQSQGWARAVLDVNIGYDEDVDRVEAVLLDVAQGMRQEPEYSGLILDEPDVWGVEALTAEGVVVRMVMKTRPAEMPKVSRELRRRIKIRFDEEGIQMRPIPRTMIINDEAEHPHVESSDDSHTNVTPA